MTDDIQAKLRQEQDVKTAADLYEARRAAKFLLGRLPVRACGVIAPSRGGRAPAPPKQNRPNERS